MKRSPLQRKTPLKQRGPIRVKGKGQVKTCALEGCGNTFYVMPSGLARTRYCSAECRQAAQRTGEWRECAREGCTNKLWAKPNQAAKGWRRFCSQACARAEQRASLRRRTGRENPNYRHGRRLDEHLQGWSLAAKPEKKCRVCPKPAVDLHHAIPRSLCPQDAKRDLRNGLPLCKECHARWHRRKLTIYRDVFRPDEWDYIVNVKLTGRETRPWLDARYPLRLR